MQYALLFYNPPASLTSEAEREATLAQLLAEMRTWRAELEKAGVFRASLRLDGSQAARSLRAQAGGVLVTDGPFAESKEVLAGFALIDCASRDEAIAWAKRCPLVRIGTVEVRPEFGVVC